MRQSINEIKRMQLLAGLINEAEDPRYAKDPEYRKADETEYEVLALNDEIAIVEDKSGDLYAFWIFDDEKEMEPYGWGKGDNADAVKNYLNDNIFDTGVGLSDWESGKQLVKIDDELKNDILDTFGSDQYISKALS